MRPKILIVENEEFTLERLILIVKQISTDELERHGIDGFQIQTAKSVAEAMKCLKQAMESAAPFDVLILDLKLPMDTPSPTELSIEDPNFGLEIIRFARETGASKQVVVCSAFPDYDYVAPAFRLGAIDFVSKKEDKGVLQRSVLGAWDRILAEESRRIFEQRFKKLVPYAQKGMAHWLSGCFSRLVQTVAHELERTKEDFNERLGLDIERDRRDPLVAHLVTIQSSLGEAIKEWSALQLSVSAKDETPQDVVVRDTLNAIVQEVLPCLTLKRAVTEIRGDDSARVISFSEDVTNIFRELLIGGLVEEPDLSGVAQDTYVPPSILIVISRRDTNAEVRFEDNLKPIESSLAQSINSGLNNALDGHFGRAWGLSVAQHAALRGGGRLSVQTSNRGNVISYLIPLAN